MGCDICNVELMIVKTGPRRNLMVYRISLPKAIKQSLPSYEKKILERQGWIWNRNDDATRPLLPTA